LFGLERLENKKGMKGNFINDLRNVIHKKKYCCQSNYDITTLIFMIKINLE